MAKLTDDQIKWVLSLDAGGLQGEINKTTGAIRNLEKDNIALARSMKEAEKGMKEAAREMEKLTKAGKENTPAFKAAEKVYRENAEDLKELSGRFKENEKSIVLHNEAIKTMYSEMKLGDMTMDQLRKRASELQNQLDLTSSSANPKEYKQLGKDLDAVQNQMGILSSKNQNLLQQFAGMNNPVGSAAQAVIGFGQALKALIANPVGIIIMAIVAAFYALKTAITGSDEATTKYEGVVAALSSVLDTGKRILTEYIALLINLVTLDFKGMKENIKNMGDMGKEMVDNAAAAYEAAIAEDALNDSIARNNDITKVNQARIAELRQISQDSTKTLEERKKASEELLRLEKDNYKMAVSNISGQYEVWKGKNQTLIKAMEKGSQKQFEQVEEYMEMVKEGTELTYDKRMELARLVNDITTTLDRGTEEEKEKFRSFFGELSSMQQEYFDGSRRDQKNASRIEEDARKEREAAAKEFIEKQIENNEQALLKEINLLKQKRAKGLLTEEEYNKNVEEETRKSLEKQAKIKGIGNDKLLSIQSQLLDAEIQQRQQTEKILQDSQLKIDLETKSYNDRLKAFGLFGIESDKLTEEQLQSKLALEKEFQAELEKITMDAENNRFKQALISAGVNEQSTGEQQEAYKLLVAQHEANIQKIKDDSSKKQIDTQKATDAAILKSLQDSQAAAISVAETTERVKVLNLKQELAEGKITIEQYNKDVKIIEAEALAERLVQQQKYLEALKALTNPTEEQKKAIETAEAAIQATQTKIYDNKINDEKSFQDRRNAVIQQYGGVSIWESYKLEKQALDEIYKDKIGHEKEYQLLLMQLRLKYAQEYINEVTPYLNAGQDLVKSLEEAGTANVQAEYAKRQSALQEQLNNGIISQEEYNEKKEQLDYDQRVAELEVQKKYADANFAMQVAQIGVATATGIMSAWASSMQLGPIAGPIAAAAMTAILAGTAVAQVAKANAERKRIKALTIEAPASSSGGSKSDASKTGSVVLKDKPGFADGGYTGQGGKHEVAGYLSDGRPFHRGEYFVAQEEMRHPEAIPLIRKLESIRRRRTDRNPLPAGFADGGYTASSERRGGNYAVIDEELIIRFEKAVDKFEKIKLQAEINYYEWKDAEKQVEKSLKLSKR